MKNIWITKGFYFLLAMGLWLSAAAYAPSDMPTTNSTTDEFCNIDPGLLIIGCLPNDRFTFSLTPTGGSGTYHLSGDVNVSNVTGTYTSPPAYSNVGDINVTIRDAADPTCMVTVYIPPPNCAADNPSIAALNGCACDNPDNYMMDGVRHFAETVGILAAPGGTWTVDFGFSSGLKDASGNVMTSATLTETSSGIYTLDFWHAFGAGYGIHAFSSTGQYISLNNLCLEPCPPCSIDDPGLLINDCLPDDRFTFSLTPSGTSFSGTYNLSGDVNLNGLTGTYTSPPALSNVGDLNVTIRDAADPSCVMTVYIPPPSCASFNPTIAAQNGCDCSNTDNYMLDGTRYFAEKIGILGVPGDTWTVDFGFSVGLKDASGNSMTSATLTETSSGLYTLDFWHAIGAGYGVHAYNSTGEYVSLNSVCLEPCPPCSIDDAGLLVNECLPDERFTFTLNPSGTTFSGTYNLQGDVNLNGLTGSYTSPPALSNVGELNVTIIDAEAPSCRMTVYIPPPSCGSADPVIAAENGCDCSNGANYELNDTEYFAENVGILSDAGDTWTVDFDYSVGLTDASGNSISSATFTETSPGLYQLSFWHRLSAGYGLHAYNSAGAYVSLNGVCFTPCSPGMRLNTHTTELAISEVYPNPTQGGIVNITFNSEASDDTQIIVFGVFGKQQMAIPITTNKGANFATLQSDELPVGTYFVAIESNGERSAPVRFIKAK